jgi:hypothetical protein
MFVAAKPKKIPKLRQERHFPGMANTNNARYIFKSIGE